MSHARFLVGDVHERLTELDDNSVDLVMTSPPFLALRSYLPQDHPDKGKEIGSEPDPGTFIDTMMQLVDDLSRVLAPHGSMVFEFGDTYAGSGGAGGDYTDTGLRAGQENFRQRTGWHRSGDEPKERYRSAAAVDSGSPNGGNGWPRAKSLALVPELFRITLAYGRNPLTGRVWWEGDQRWMVRNVVRWVRPNPPVGALGDKFRPATSELTVFTRDPRRYFDLDAVRSPLKYPEATPPVSRAEVVSFSNSNSDDQIGLPKFQNPAGAPPLDWWNITTSGYPGSHYAVYPAELCVIPVKSMCPERVCRTCGEPSRRITKRTPEYAAAPDAIGDFNTRAETGAVSGSRSTLTAAAGREITSAENLTVGWSECGCGDGCTPDTYQDRVTPAERLEVDGRVIVDRPARVEKVLIPGECNDPSHWRPGMVLDPFAGTGTTLAVATGHGRDATGIDIDQRNADLAIDRIGPLFLTVEHPTPA